MLFYLEKNRIFKRSIKNKISTFAKVSFLVREVYRNIFTRRSKETSFLVRKISKNLPGISF